MSHSPRYLRRLFCIVVLAAFFQPSASEAAPKKAPPKKAHKILTTGRIAAVAPGMIYVVTADKKRLAVKIPRGQRVVRVLGKLTPGQLRLGMIVRLQGELKGTSMTEPIRELKIFTPADGYRMAILQDAPTEPAYVTGRLSGFQNGKLTVLSGGRKITATLAADAEIMVDTVDYSIAKPGDQVKVDARSRGAGPATARQVTITLHNPAADAPKAGARPRQKQ